MEKRKNRDSSLPPTLKLRWTSRSETEGSTKSMTRKEQRDEKREQRRIINGLGS